MEEIIIHLKSIVKGTDDQQRRKLVNTLRDMSIYLETPEESMERIAFTPLQLCGAKIGKDLRIFHQLSSSDSPIHLETLAGKTGADPMLLERWLRYFSSLNMVNEPCTSTFAANNVTHALASPKGESYIDLYYGHVTPTFLETPRFLAKTDYANPIDPCNLPFQNYSNCNSDMFTFLEEFPEKGSMYDRHMEFLECTTDWDRVYTILQERTPLSSDEVLFVDVGGGRGHQSARLVTQYPNISGRVVLQDLPHVINNGLKTPGVEKMAYNIFEPQPIKGAKCYYSRGVLHCFPDGKCQEILQNTVTAMNADSVLLIDEQVMPDENAHWQVTGLDLQLLASFGSLERTRSHWGRLLGSVGLQILEVHAHEPGMYDSLITAVKAI